MTGDHDQDDLPADPVSSHDADRIAKHVGGTVIAALQRAHHDRLTIGAYEHPHGMRSLNAVTIRMYDLDGAQTDAIDLSLSEVQGMITALLEAVSACWGIAPGTMLPPPDGDQDDDET